MQSVLRSLEVLEKVVAMQPVRLSEVASVIDLPKSTIQRALVTLADAGWIRAVPGDTTRWEITPHVRGLVLRSSSNVDVVHASQRAMAELRDLTGETVQLKLLSGTDDFIVVDHADTRQSVRPVMALGTVMPIIASSSGFAVMALLDDALNVEIIERTRTATPFDSNFVPDSVSDIRALIEDARRTGYATHTGWLRDVVGVGAAITDHAGGPIAGLSITVPIERFDPSQESSWGKAVVKAATQISNELGADSADYPRH